MKLYWEPHTCAIGIHVLLEETGLPYETEKIDVGGGATREPPFLAVNPKGKVPTLVRDDGSVLTEFAAIATWLARRNLECAPRGGQIGRFRLTPLLGLPEDGSHDETSITQRRVQTASR